jgi:light-independent protochlorophyllide reductase B subunit
MELTVWTYEGPPHVGAIRVANSMRDVHFVLHAPQGDTYADLLFTMIERNKKRPPVTYTTFQARDLSGDTAEIFKTAARDAVARFKPQALLVGASCTAELIQDDPGGLAKTLGLNVPVVPLEMPSYQKKENWGAAETFYRLVRAFAGGAEARNRPNRQAATFSARHRSGFATATTSSRWSGWLNRWASGSTRLRRSALRPPISPGSRRLISTSCSIRKSPTRRPAGSSASSARRW